CEILRVWSGLGEIVQQFIKRCGGRWDVFAGYRSGKQPGQELAPVLGKMKQSFEHQMLDHCLPPNIDNECYLRPDLCDISEVLFGANANVSAPLGAQLPQLWNDMEVRCFI